MAKMGEVALDGVQNFQIRIWRLSFVMQRALFLQSCRVLASEWDRWTPKPPPHNVLAWPCLQISAVKKCFVFMLDSAGEAC